MDYKELERLCNFYSNQGCRRGQAYMNALAQIDFPLFVEVTGTEFDCFYDDTRVHLFFKRMHKEEGLI